ncbi:hypothetical protein HV824_01915 [Myxococcus sp. AM009]|uniref:hypothetical protein n=1 Tax=unclassified Myxococcus TaxID=2648731 RepID=UPI001595A0E8|nr:MULTISPECIES: hypothetical protein [unclassified Myxococcus]NVI96881.1 hypothetical protein [Myxococcus sp. AM009]NVJ13950.1 hypothetical protein [Myxococcus sp. AM010]
MSAHSTGRVAGSIVPWFGAVLVLQLAHAFAAASALDAPRALPLVHDVAGWGSGVLAVFGTLAAARSFAQGDYLRKVWGGLAAGALLSLVSTALRSYWLHAVPDVPFTQSPLLPVRMLVVVLANVSTTYALILLAMTYRQSGLQPPPSLRSNALWVGTAVAALAVGVPVLATEVRHLGTDAISTMSAVISLASTLADMTTILLVAPILSVAYMLRGGRLAWVWWAMGISGAMWLFYDARGWLAPLLPGDAAQNAELLRTLRTSGLVLLGLAGWLQRTALAPQQLPAAEPSAQSHAGMS